MIIIIITNETVLEDEEMVSNGFLQVNSQTEARTFIPGNQTMCAVEIKGI